MALKKFNVASTLDHNGKVYQRGDTVLLDPKSPEATVLLNAGVIQTDTIEVPQEPEQQPEEQDQQEGEAAQEPEQQPEVGGAETETGEPSVDGDQEGKTPGFLGKVAAKLKDGMDAVEEDISANL